MGRPRTKLWGWDLGGEYFGEILSWLFYLLFAVGDAVRRVVVSSWMSEFVEFGGGGMGGGI